MVTFNGFSLDKNGTCFTNNIFNSISLNENIQIFIQISLKFVAEGQIYSKSTLFKVNKQQAFS